MTDLRKQAEEYAKDALKHVDDVTMWKVDAFRLIAEAYEQGYIEGDTKDDKSEAEAEFSNEAPDCRYFSEGYPEESVESKQKEDAYDYYVCLPNGDTLSDLAPYIYERHKKPDWSINVTLKRCTWKQVLTLSRIYPELIMFKSKDVKRVKNDECTQEHKGD